MSYLSSNNYKLPDTGDTLDIFTIESRLHKGAMSTLFLARDLLSTQKVVLKIPHDDILNHPIFLYHYQNEERISRLLDHPGIIRFIHRQRSRQYIIMEYIEGRDLRSMVGRNRWLDLETALGLMLSLCEIVSYLHKNKIVHLDLKPENIICLKDSTIKIVDFGLASCQLLPDFLSRDLNNPQGTPWYIAPEQLLGQRGDPRCDIYSMGMLFYEMLTGRLPWSRSSKIHIARRRLSHDPTPPRYHNPEIPPQIQDIILRAISRCAKERYACTDDMHQDIKEWQKLPVTPSGLNCSKISLLRRLFSFKSIKPDFKTESKIKSSPDKPQIIGALIDTPEGSLMLDELKKQALINSGEVTLVHAIEEESDSSFRRYGIAAEGERLMKELERYVQNLRRLNIDPNIRLIKGDAVEVLKNICRELDAQLLILGSLRKKDGFLRGASTKSRLEKITSCTIISAEKQPFSPDVSLFKLQPDQMTDSQVLALDIFLVDLWYEHLHYHTDFIYKKLLYPDHRVDLSENNCRFGRWLNSLRTSEQWKKITSELVRIHRYFHKLAFKISEQCRNSHACMQDMYIQKTLPLSYNLKKELGKLSVFLRSHLDVPPPVLPFMKEESYPFTIPDMPCYGPLLSSINLVNDMENLIHKGEKPVSYSTLGEKQ